MRAVVLAAGWGERLGIRVASTPKPLLPIGARTPLDFVVSALDALTLDSVDVVVNAADRSRFESWRARRRNDPSLRIWCNGVTRAEDRMGAVADLDAWMRHAGPDTALLVCGADMVFDGSLAGLAKAARAERSIVVHDVGSPARVRQLASVELDESEHVTRFVEKDPAPRTHLAAPALYGLPAHALPDVSAFLREGGHPDNLGHLAAWWVERSPLRGVPLDGRWIDVGTPEEYERALREFGNNDDSPTG
jgi:NDP-sugar pyrophosphorylase family protein